VKRVLWFKLQQYGYQECAEKFKSTSKEAGKAVVYTDMCLKCSNGVTSDSIIMHVNRGRHTILFTRLSRIQICFITR
jgi:hypothetical protein